MLKMTLDSSSPDRADAGRGAPRELKYEWTNEDFDPIDRGLCALERIADSLDAIAGAFVIASDDKAPGVAGYIRDSARLAVAAWVEERRRKSRE